MLPTKFFPKIFRRKRVFMVALVLCTLYFVYQLFIIITLTSSVAETEADRIREKEQQHSSAGQEDYPKSELKYHQATMSRKASKLKNRFKQPLGKIILGVGKFDFKLYQEKGKNFTCLKSGEEIPFSHVNDDYCDCQDGSDEPSTDACPQFRFHCIGKSFDGKESIPSSMVNDGICDCCDGSDEWLNRTNSAMILPHLNAKPVALTPKGVFVTPCIWRCG